MSSLEFVCQNCGNSFFGRGTEPRRCYDCGYNVSPSFDYEEGGDGEETENYFPEMVVQNFQNLVSMIVDNVGAIGNGIGTTLYDISEGIHNSPRRREEERPPSPPQIRRRRREEEEEELDDEIIDSSDDDDEVEELFTDVEFFIACNDCERTWTARSGRQHQQCRNCSGHDNDVIEIFVYRCQCGVTWKSESRFEVTSLCEDCREQNRNRNRNPRQIPPSMPIHIREQRNNDRTSNEYQGGRNRNNNQQQGRNYSPPRNNRRPSPHRNTRNNRRPSPIRLSPPPQRLNNNNNSNNTDPIIVHSSDEEEERERERRRRLRSRTRSREPPSSQPQRNKNKSTTNNGQVVIPKPPSSSSSSDDKKKEELNEDLECKICMENRVDRVFLCGHTTCHKCCKKLRECPMCKRRITKVIKLFL